MENLITEVFGLIKDYRSDERNLSVIIKEDAIRRWVCQFEEEDRVFLLNELVHIFSKRYISKDRAKLFLRNLIEKLCNQNNYSSIQDFLSHTVFLDLQPKGKSQKVLLRILKEIIEKEYNFDFELCGSQSKNHNIYIDDILATGNTLYQDIKHWVEQEFSTGLTNLDALKTDKIKLYFAFLFTHKKNVLKKEREFGLKIDKDFNKFYRILKGTEIDNSITPESNLDFILPIENGQAEFVKEYQLEITQFVDKNNIEKNYQRFVSDSFYRDENMPKIETLFSSHGNRIRFENLMLKAGIQILKGSKTLKKNIRALGYSLPSQKDFGFGTLCFTWRNIPNNVPLTFWYSDNNHPLFIVKKGDTLTVDEILSEHGI